jgi:hypothetical protein
MIIFINDHQWQHLMLRLDKIEQSILALAGKPVDQKQIDDLTAKLKASGDALGAAVKTNS